MNWKDESVFTLIKDPKKQTKKVVKPKPQIWIPGYYTTKIVKGRKIRVWIQGYYRYL